MGVKVKKQQKPKGTFVHNLRRFEQKLISMGATVGSVKRKRDDSEHIECAG